MGGGRKGGRGEGKGGRGEEGRGGRKERRKEKDDVGTWMM